MILGTYARFATTIIMILSIIAEVTLVQIINFING